MTDELDNELESQETALILREMSEIRRGQTREFQEPEVLDRYLTLTSRLGEKIIARIGKRNVKRFAKRVRRDPRLRGFDSFQTGYWSKENPGFCRDLNNATIASLGDNLAETDDGHHVFQAIKLLAIQGGFFGDRINEVTASILPFNGALRYHRQSPLSRFFKGIFGYGFEADTRGNSNLVVTCDREFDEDLLEEARRRGFSSLETIMHRKDFEELKQKVPYQCHDLGEVRDVGEMPNGLVRGVFKYVPLLPDLVAGTLPEFLQDRLQTASGREYNAGAGTILSSVVEAAAGVLGAFLFRQNPELIAAYSYLGIEGLARLFSGISGVLPAKILFYPLEKILDARDRRRNERGHLIKAEFLLRDAPKETEVSRRVYYDLLKIADKKVPLFAQSRLTTGPDNYHTYAQEFDKVLTDAISADDSLRGYTNFPRFADKRNQVFDLYAMQRVGRFTKLAALACLPERRYVVVTISPTENIGVKGDKNPSEVYLSGVNEILAGDSSFKRKAKGIRNRLRTCYTRLTYLPDSIASRTDEIKEPRQDIILS